MSNIYVVTLARANTEIGKRMKENFPGSYEYTKTVFLVRVDSSTLASDIAKGIGLKGNDRVKDASGVVFKLNRGYSGYTKPELWDWLSNLD